MTSQVNQSSTDIFLFVLRIIPLVLLESKVVEELVSLETIQTKNYIIYIWLLPNTLWSRYGNHDDLKVSNWSEIGKTYFLWHKKSAFLYEYSKLLRISIYVDKQSWPTQFWSIKIWFIFIYVLLLEKLKFWKMSTNFILSKNCKKWANFIYFAYFFMKFFHVTAFAGKIDNRKKI